MTFSAASLRGAAKRRNCQWISTRSCFHRLRDYTTVYSDGGVVFTFRNGVDIGTEI